MKINGKDIQKIAIINPDPLDGGNTRRTTTFEVDIGWPDLDLTDYRLPPFENYKEPADPIKDIAEVIQNMNGRKPDRVWIDEATEIDPEVIEKLSKREPITEERIEAFRDKLLLMGAAVPRAMIARLMARGISSEMIGSIVPDPCFPEPEPFTFAYKHPAFEDPIFLEDEDTPNYAKHARTCAAKKQKRLARKKHRKSVNKRHRQHKDSRR